MVKSSVIFGQLSPECKRPVPGVKIRKVTLQDLPAIEQLSRDEHFDMGYHNLELYFRTSPDTWELAETEDGEIIAYNAQHLLKNGVFMGHQFLVRSDYKGRGVTRMFNIMHYFPADVPNLGDATPDTLQRYGTSLPGMVLQWKVIGFSGAIRSNAFRVEMRHRKVDIVPLDARMFRQLAKYDFKLLGYDRSAFMREWCLPTEQSWSFTVAAIEGKILKGFGTLRKYSRYFGFCPVYADEPDIGWNICVTLIRQMQLGDFLYIPVPANNATTMQLATEVGLCPMETQIRMESKECYELMGKQLQVHKVFAFHEYWPL